MTFFWQDKLKDISICKSLVENYPQIKREVIKFISDPDTLYNYPKYNVGDKPLYENYWKGVPFSTFDGEFISMYASPEEKQFLKFIISNAKENCPTIAGIIKDLEEEGNIANGFISRFIPGTIINPHRGWTPDYMKINLGLLCDSECKITVGSETQAWEEGKILAFKDGGAHPRSAKHEGTSEEIILSLDIKISYLKQYIPNI